MLVKFKTYWGISIIEFDDELIDLFAKHPFDVSVTYDTFKFNAILNLSTLHVLIIEPVTVNTRIADLLPLYGIRFVKNNNFRKLRKIFFFYFI